MQKQRVYYILAVSDSHFRASNYRFVQGFSVFAKIVKSRKPRRNACQVALTRAPRARHASNAGFWPPMTPQMPKSIEKATLARIALPTLFLRGFLKQCQNRRSPGLPQKSAPDLILRDLLTNRKNRLAARKPPRLHF